MKLALLLLLLCLPARAEIPYRVTVDDPNNDFGTDRAAILANLDAAVQDWARFLASKGTLWIEIRVQPNTATGRFAGGPTGNAYVRMQSGLRVYESSGGHLLRTGRSVDSTKPDVRIDVQPDYLRSRHWIDPRPALRTDPIPRGKIDLVTAFAHELGHGFGLNGWLDLKTGLPGPAHALTLFDTLVANAASGAPLFSGPIATKLYGGPVPVTFFSAVAGAVSLSHGGVTFPAVQDPSQNFYHLGRFQPGTEESDLSFFSLMAGCWLSPDWLHGQGLRVRVNPLDAAVLEDLGIPAR